MINQQVCNYAVLTEFPRSNLQPNGDSASPKEMIFHILPDNSQDVSILDIGFGAGTLGKMVKSNQATAHWHIDGVDGWEPNCQNLDLFNQRIYRNVWHGLAQEIPSSELSKYNIICLLDVIEKLLIHRGRSRPSGFGCQFG